VPPLRRARLLQPDHLFLGTRANNAADLKDKRHRQLNCVAESITNPGQIYIVYRGVEMKGKVDVRLLEPDELAKLDEELQP